MQSKQASLAAVLKERRTALGLTLQQVEFDTKIRPKYIAALEERRFEELPVDIYLERILTNYAYYLGLDPKVALKLLKIDKDRHLRAKRYPGSFSEVNELGELMHNDEQFMQPIRAPSFIFTPKVITVMFTGLAGLMIAFYLSRLVFDYSAAPDLVIAEPQTGVVVSSNNVRVVGHAEKGSIVSINNLVVPVTESGDFQATLYLQDGANKVSVRAEDNGKVSEQELTVQADIPEREPMIDSDSPVVVELDAGALDKSWVRVVADGEQVFEGMLDGTKTFEAQSYVSLLAGNAGAVSAKFNGVEQGALGGSGEVVRKVFGEEPEGTVPAAEDLTTETPA